MNTTRKIIKNTMNIRTKRFLIHSLTIITYVVTFIVSLALEAILVHFIPGIRVLLAYFKIDAENGLSGRLVGTLIAAAFTRLTPFKLAPLLKQQLGRWLFPVNLKLADNQEHKKILRSYYDAVKNRLDPTMSDELQEVWQSNNISNKLLMPLRVEERETLSAANSKQGRTHSNFDVGMWLDYEFFLDPFRSSQPLTVQGEPGSGKSTLLMEIFRQQMVQLDSRTTWIPLVVFAHELTQEMVRQPIDLKRFLLFYYEHTAKISEPTVRSDYDNLCKFININYEKYQFVLIIDGLDEITERTHYTNILQKLNGLIETELNSSSRQNRPNRYIVSCRTDDNTHQIRGHLLSLLAVDTSSIFRYLTVLAQFQHHHQPMMEPQTRAVIANLKICKSSKLLQNYMGNPFLLTTIIDYFRKNGEAKPTNLSKVFEHVLIGSLEREITKKTKHDENQNSTKKRGEQLLEYLKDLLAPYCFARVTDTADISQCALRLAEYVKHSGDLHNILLGEIGSEGFLPLTYQARRDRSVETAKMKAFGLLANRWGNDKADQLLDFTTIAVKGASTFDQFFDECLEYLHRDVINTLKEARLAEIDNGIMTRFRHRRMQDYFAAMYIDTIGLNYLKLDLADVWLRDPLRIYAAVSDNVEALLASFLKLYQRSQYDTIGVRLNIIENATQAVAYLPRPETLDSLTESHKIAMRIGNHAKNLYLECVASEQKDITDPTGSYSHYRDSCLEALGNLYGSEFLATISSLFKANTSQQEWKWHKIKKDILHQPDLIQGRAFLHIYPVKRQHPDLPISNALLFYFVMEDIPFSRTTYRSLCNRLDLDRQTRIAFRIFGMTLHAVALFIPVLFLWQLWIMNDIFTFRITYIGIFVIIYLLLGMWLRTESKLDNFWDLYQLPVQYSLYYWKRFWPLRHHFQHLWLNFSKKLFALFRNIKEYVIRNAHFIAGSIIAIMCIIILYYFIGSTIWNGITRSEAHIEIAWKLSQAQGSTVQIIQKADADAGATSRLSQTIPLSSDVLHSLDTQITQDLQETNTTLEKITSLLPPGEDPKSEEAQQILHSKNDLVSAKNRLSELQSQIGRMMRDRDAKLQGPAELIASARTLRQDLTAPDLISRITNIQSLTSRCDTQFDIVREHLKLPPVSLSTCLFQNSIFHMDDENLSQLSDAISTSGDLADQLEKYISKEKELRARAETLKCSKVYKDILDNPISKILIYCKNMQNLQASNLKTECDQLIDQVSKRNKATTSLILGFLLLAGFATMIVVIINIFRKKYGNAEGDRKLQSIHADRQQLLEFIKSNPYSLEVTQKAIVHLRSIVEKDPSEELLQSISAIQQYRMQRPGDINTRIAEALFELQHGLRAILNRVNKSQT